MKKRIICGVVICLMTLCCLSPFCNAENRFLKIDFLNTNSNIEINNDRHPSFVKAWSAWKIKDNTTTYLDLFDDPISYNSIECVQTARANINAKIAAEEQRKIDITYIAKTVWGEARGLSYSEKAQVAWCILNRVDNGRFPNTVVGVVTQSGQFHGYSASFPTCEWAVAEDVYDRWLAEKNGASVNRELPQGYCYFSGSGGHNHFRINA